MDLALAALTNGVAIGALYGMFALSVVVIFRTGGLFNFAQGSMAMFVAFIAYSLMTAIKIPVQLALVVGLGAGAIAGVVVHTLVITPRRSSDHLNQLFRTMGLTLL